MSSRSCYRGSPLNHFASVGWQHHSMSCVLLCNSGAHRLTLAGL